LPQARNADKKSFGGCVRSGLRRGSARQGIALKEEGRTKIRPYKGDCKAVNDICDREAVNDICDREAVNT